MIFWVKLLLQKMTVKDLYNLLQIVLVFVQQRDLLFIIILHN